MLRVVTIAKSGAARLPPRAARAAERSSA